jgi:hypothetical protein
MRPTSLPSQIGAPDKARPKMKTVEIIAVDLSALFCSSSGQITA